MTGALRGCWASRPCAVAAVLMSLVVGVGVAAPQSARAADFTLGLEYAQEWHHGVIGRRRVANTFTGDGGVIDVNARMHRISIVDTTGFLLAGLGGGASKYTAKRKAIRKWASDGAHSGDTISYSYSMPAVVPGVITRLSFAWGADAPQLQFRQYALSTELEKTDQDMWSLEVLIEYTSISLLPKDRLFFMFTGDVWWKTIAVRGTDPTAKKDANEIVVGESFLGLVLNAEIGSVVLPWLRVIGYAGWDPLIGGFALLQDPSNAPAHNWQYGVKADIAIGPWVQVAANYSTFSGGLRSGDNARHYIARMLQLRAGVYF